MFSNLKFNPVKEIGELLILIAAILIGVFCKTGFWIALLIFFGLEIVYLFVYGLIESKIVKDEPMPEKEEINFHEYDDEDENK